MILPAWYKVVCSKCSDSKTALEYDGNKMNRVCKDCFSILTGREKAENKKKGILEVSWWVRGEGQWGQSGGRG